MAGRKPGARKSTAGGTPGRIRTESCRRVLIDLKRTLLDDIRKCMGAALDEDTRLVFEAAQDNPDRSVADLLKHVQAAVLGGRSEEIDCIDAALQKLDEGTYGTCEECGCRIPAGRLRAIPYAICCVDCQQRIDVALKRRRQTLAGSSSQATDSVPPGFDDIGE